MPLRCQRFRLRLMRYWFDILFTPGNQATKCTWLTYNIEETMTGQRVEMHVNTIVVADDMYEDGMLEELKKRVVKTIIIYKS